MMVPDGIKIVQFEEVEAVEENNMTGMYSNERFNAFLKTIINEEYKYNVIIPDVYHSITLSYADEQISSKDVYHECDAEVRKVDEFAGSIRSAAKKHGQEDMFKTIYSLCEYKKSVIRFNYSKDLLNNKKADVIISGKTVYSGTLGECCRYRNLLIADIVNHVVYDNFFELLTARSYCTEYKEYVLNILNKALSEKGLIVQQQQDKLYIKGSGSKRRITVQYLDSMHTEEENLKTDVIESFDTEAINDIVRDFALQKKLEKMHLTIREFISAIEPVIDAELFDEIEIPDLYTAEKFSQICKEMINDKSSRYKGSVTVCDIFGGQAKIRVPDILLERVAGVNGYLDSILKKINTSLHNAGSGCICDDIAMFLPKKGLSPNNPELDDKGLNDYISGNYSYKIFYKGFNTPEEVAAIAGNNNNLKFYKESGSMTPPVSDIDIDIVHPSELREEILKMNQMNPLEMAFEDVFDVENTIDDSDEQMIHKQEIDNNNNIMEK